MKLTVGRKALAAALVLAAMSADAAAQSVIKLAVGAPLTAGMIFGYQVKGLAFQQVTTIVVK